MQALLSTAYLPNINYFQLLVKADSILIEQHETYPKQTYRNRCYIYGPNGKQLLTIPVIKPNGNHTQTKDILIDNKTNWQKQHWRSIVTAYNNTPYFEHYMDEFFSFYNQQETSLIYYNTALTNTICKLIDEPKRINFTHDFIKPDNHDNDFRNKLNPKESTIVESPRYFQSFENKFGFIPNLSIIDLLFNIGPETHKYYKQKNIN